MGASATSSIHFLTGQYAGHQLELPETVVLGRAPEFGVVLGEGWAVQAVLRRSI